MVQTRSLRVAEARRPEKVVLQKAGGGSSSTPWVTRKHHASIIDLIDDAENATPRSASIAFRN